MVKILGIGDNVVDIYTNINTMYPGGNALNIAAYAAMSGVEAGYLGVFGDDRPAKHVYEKTKSLGIDVSHCRFKAGENGYAKVNLVDGDRVFVGSNKGGVSKEHLIELTDLDLDYIREYDVVHTSIFSYIEGQLKTLSDHANFVSMDFSDSASEEYLKQCAPHLDCACISCGDTPDEEIKEQINRIISYGCRHIVIATRGARGALVYVDGKLYEQSPHLVEAKDTMGAGDSFITSFLVNYIDGMKYAVDFDEKSGSAGIVTAAEYKDVVIKSSLYKAAVFSADNCQRDGAFGFGERYE